MDPQARNLLSKAREHYQRKEYEAARPLLEQALAAGAEGFADIHNMLGVIYHDMGDLARAQERFEAALRINPNYTEAILNLSVTYNDVGRYGEARKLMEHLGRAQDVRQGSIDGLERFAKGKIANLHADVAQAYYDSGLLNEAIEELTKAIRLCGDFVDLRVRLGVMLTEAQRFDEARGQFEESVKVRPDYPQARIYLGVNHHKAGRRDDAIAQWRAVLAKDPANRSARMYLRLVGEPPPDAPPVPVAETGAAGSGGEDPPAG
jgi:tetratricopeptide (TPR) repeat protein